MFSFFLSAPIYAAERRDVESSAWSAAKTGRFSSSVNMLNTVDKWNASRSNYSAVHKLKLWTVSFLPVCSTCEQIYRTHIIHVLTLSLRLGFHSIFHFRSMAYGTEYGLVIVDIVQKICLLNIASPDLYGAQDPYARTPRSPKRTDTTTSRDEQARSPSIDQVCTTC